MVVAWLLERLQTDSMQIVIMSLSSLPHISVNILMPIRSLSSDAACHSTEHCCLALRIALFLSLDHNILSLPISIRRNSKGIRL